MFVVAPVVGDRILELVEESLELVEESDWYHLSICNVLLSHSNVCLNSRFVIFSVH